MGAATINTVPVDFSSHLHWELTDLASPEEMTEWKQTVFHEMFLKHVREIFISGVSP